MFRLLPTLLVVSVCALAFGGDSKNGKDGKDDIVGAVWRYTVTNDGESVSGQFHVFERKIFKGANQVGAVDAEDNDETTLRFTDWPEMNGKAVLRKVRRNPPEATGTLTKTDGTKWQMKVTWKDG